MNAAYLVQPCSTVPQVGVFGIISGRGQVPFSHSSRGPIRNRHNIPDPCLLKSQLIHLSLNNNDLCSVGNIIKAIQDLFSTFDLPKALIQGAIFDVDQLAISVVGESNNIGVGLKFRVIYVLRSDVVAVQRVTADASFSKKVQHFSCR